MDSGERFTRLLVAQQPRIYGFIFSLVHDRAATDDLLQDVCSVLWRKFDDFEEGTDFGAWALKVARLSVFEWRRKQAKMALSIGENELELLADQSARIAEQHDELRSALDDCLEKLGGHQRKLIHARYHDDVPVSKVAEKTGRSRVAVYKALKKIHEILLDCIQAQLEPAKS